MLFVDPTVFSGIIRVRKTKILIRIETINLGTLWTTIIIGRTRDPLPMPDRKLILGVPAIFPRIIVIRKTKILTRIVHLLRRYRRWCIIVINVIIIVDGVVA